MFTDPLMSIIDAGAKMFLEYIERVSSVATFFKRSKNLLQNIHVLKIQFVEFQRPVKMRRASGRARLCWRTGTMLRWVSSASPTHSIQ